MFKKLFIILTNVLLLFLIIFSFIDFNAKASRVSIIVPIVKQASSNWCWAACAEMAGKSWNSTSTRTQYDVVYHLKGTFLCKYPDVGGNLDLSDSVKGSTYATSVNKAFYYAYVPFSLAQINNQISNNRQPLQACINWYDNNNNITKSHMVIIDGVDYACSNVCYINPWDATRTWIDFSRFCYSHWDGGKYTKTVWTY